METFNTLLDIACGRTPEGEVTSRRWQLAVAALLLSLVFAALWGIAAALGFPAGELTSHVFQNLYKVPMVVLLSTVAAIPAGLLCWKLAGGQASASDLLLGFTTGVFSGTLVLASIAPLLALYYKSSEFAGPIFALGSVAAALVVGTFVFLRSIYTEAHGKGRKGLGAPAMVLIAIQMAALLQLVSLAAPIVYETTPVDGGIDKIVSQADGDRY